MFETTWRFPQLADCSELPESDLVAVGADLQPGTLFGAYRAGLFPMPVEERQIGWFWPQARGVFLPGSLKVSRSLRRSRQRYSVTLNQDFVQVLAACGDPGRPHGWIDDNIASAYTKLHELGVAHSIEVWDDEGLAGGLYGLAIGGLFAGESMFHRRVDASKVALLALCKMLWPQDRISPARTSPTLTSSDTTKVIQNKEPSVLLDTQWATPHLSSLGAVEVDRLTYARLLSQALQLPTPSALAGPIKDQERQAP